MKILSYQDNQGHIYDLVVAADDVPSKCRCCSHFHADDLKTCFQPPDCGLEREVWVERTKQQNSFKLMMWADSDANIYDLVPVTDDKAGCDCDECEFRNKPSHCVHSPNCGAGYYWKRRGVTNVQDQS